jgi:hypothetical protein
MKPLLCMIGLHKWGRTTYETSVSSNVRNWKKRCLRCGELLRWVEVKKR